MAVRSLVPLLTGGVVIIGALAVAYARRPTRALFIPGDDSARFAPDPVGPDEGMVEVLELALAANPVAKTEAEAMAGSGADWPLVDASPIGSEVPQRAAMADSMGSDDGFVERREGDSERVSGIQTGFTEVDPGPTFLDLEIELEDLEAPTERGPTVVVAELAPDDAAPSGLERVDTLEDISDTPTDPMATREKPERTSEFSQRETLPDPESQQSRSS